MRGDWRGNEEEADGVFGMRKEYCIAWHFLVHRLAPHRRVHWLFTVAAYFVIPAGTCAFFLIPYPSEALLVFNCLEGIWRCAIHGAQLRIVSPPGEIGDGDTDNGSGGDVKDVVAVVFETADGDQGGADKGRHDEDHPC